jgi:D-glycero-D-manno-heptose 1,7-bisphosphate phosphatase
VVTDLSKVIFLDRDGVINKPWIKNGKGYAPRFLKDFKIYSSVKSDIKKLKENGYKVFVITNQPDVNNKLIKKKTLNAMHKILKKKVLVDKILYCPHDKKENCKCRKPKTGLIKNAIKGKKIYLKKSYMIGDRASDIEAGIKAGCKTIFINKNYSESKPKKQDKTVKSLNAAVNYILKIN